MTDGPEGPQADDTLRAAGPANKRFRRH